MIFHENGLLADDSHEISYLIFFENWDLSSAAVVIAPITTATDDKSQFLRVNKNRKSGIINRQMFVPFKNE